MLNVVDKGVGNLTATLVSEGMWDNMLIVMTSVGHLRVSLCSQNRTTSRCLCVFCFIAAPSLQTTCDVFCRRTTVVIADLDSRPTTFR
jgi:hypothetical protein